MNRTPIGFLPTCTHSLFARAGAATRCRAAATVACVFLTGAALGQTAPTAPPETTTSAPPAANSANSTGATEATSLLAPPDERPGFKTIVAGGARYQFKSDLDDAGDVSVTRVDTGVQSQFELTERIGLGVNLGYRFDRYEFSNDSFGDLGLGRAPWRDIHTLGLAAILNFELDDRWTVSVGALGQFAGEAQADAGDSFGYGGVIGVAHRFSDTLLVGLGVGVLQPIEDDVKLFPSFVLEWKLNEVLRVSTQAGPTAVLRDGIELVYNGLPNWELALGANYQTSRFRLTEDAAVSDGIGEDTMVPLWLRASWVALPGLRLHLFTGVTVYEEFTISDRNGLKLTDETVDPSLTVGAYVSYRF